MATKEPWYIRFGNAIKGATGVSLMGVLIILGTNGKEFLDFLGALPALISAFSAGLPLGFWSGAVGGVLAAGFHLFARSWHRRSFMIEMATIIVGLTAVMVQPRDPGIGGGINATLVGLVAGLVGLFTAKGLRAMFTKEEADVDDGSGEGRSDAVPPTD